MKQYAVQAGSGLIRYEKVCKHLFGTMKRTFNHGYFLLKGLRKVNGEVGFDARL